MRGLVFRHRPLGNRHARYLTRLIALQFQANSIKCNFFVSKKTGATPYVDVRCKELAQRVQRGLRLKQPSNIGVSLYQIMVSCWQIDLDERPNFQELFDIMQEAFNHSLDYLSFNLFPDFVYERYDPNIEANR